MFSRLTVLQELQLKLTPLEGREEGTATLLALLPKLHQLTALQLTAAPTHAVPDAVAYSALTANSQLQDLWLSQDTLGTGVAAAWPHIFPLQGKQLMQLTALHLSYCTPKMGITALQGVVNSCPCLQRLTLYDINYAFDWQPAIVQLHQLTELRMTHVCDYTALCVLAQLTGLSSLVIAQPSTISDRGVLNLTALRQLTYLSLSSEGIFRGLAANQTRTLHLVSQEASVLFTVAVHTGKGATAAVRV